LNGKWYVYYAADDGLNENHRMWVLESLGDNPQGGYRCRGPIDTQGWAIDGTILELQGQLYFLWSGWPGKENGQQNLYIAPMSNPWTLSAGRVLLAAPERDWECVDMRICEGPQVLNRNGKVFVVYSASGSWTIDYCLAMLAFKGGDPIDPSNWENRGRIFETVPDVLGTGHCSFVTSPDGCEDWILFHTKTKHKKGWNDRHVHAQRFTWTEDGSPCFGKPLAARIGIEQPSSGQG
jgi:GH43 family beta-xylosidase